MPKIIKYWDDSRRAVYAGVKKVVDAVKVTMGPKGKNVILERSFGAPVVTNDGVTVAKEIELEDKFENIGAELVKEAANKTNDAAGDGTTTTALLVYAIAKEGLKSVRAGVNPFALNKGLHKAADAVIEELKKRSKKIESREEIEQVATISAQDPEVWKLIADIMEEIWKDGVVTVEEGKSIGLEKEVVKGMQFDQGYISPYFITDSTRMEAVIEKPYIIITDKKISSIKELLPILEQIAATGKKDIVIIADDVEGEALATLVLNKLRGVLNVLAVKAPGFGDRKKEMLKDIAAVTGGQVITEELGLKLENATLDMLGQADKVIADKDKTIIVGGKGRQEDIDARVEMIRTELQKTTSDYDREKLQERLARLVGGVAVIRVGAATEMELKNKKYKIEDALNATRAAIEEGIVPGGGTALLKVQKVLDELKTDDKDEQIGIEIVKSAIEYPAKQIADNAGFKGDLVVEKVKENNDFAYGFNAKTGEYGDLFKMGVIDPAKVVRVALENAVSAAGMLLTTDAVVADKPEKKEETPAGGMWDMAGMM